MLEKEDKESKVEANITSPLGEDPLEKVVDNKETTKETSKESEDEEKVVEISEEELIDLKDKSHLYNLITSDPKLSQMIADFYRAKTGRVPDNDRAARKETANEEQIPEHIQRILDENKSLREEFDRFQSNLAAREVAEFRAKHPDLDSIRKEVGALMQQHNMTLEQAYDYAKYAKQQNNQSRPSVPTKPTTESHSVGGDDIERTEKDTLKEIEREIADSKATPRLEDAIDKAFKAATKMHGA